MPKSESRNFVFGMLRWELSFIPIEMACTALGLWLLLAQRNWWLGGSVLVLTLVMSLGVRKGHYSRLVARHHPGSAPLSS